jgi:uncharacterized protein (DUF4415 family)
LKTTCYCWRSGDGRGVALEPAAKAENLVARDVEVVDWFKSNGRGYQMRINPILRRVMMEGRKRMEEK